MILAEDITHRKLLEETISDMSQKLIVSQEQERTRIARELHDDIGQRLALLTMELEELQQGHPGSRIRRTTEADLGDSERCTVLIARVALFNPGVSGLGSSR